MCREEGESSAAVGQRETESVEGAGKEAGNRTCPDLWAKAKSLESL